MKIKVLFTHYMMIVAMILVTMGLCAAGAWTYNYVRSTRIDNEESQVPRVNASSSIYNEVYKNDLNYLHRVGNKQAVSANWNHAKAVYNAKQNSLGQQSVGYYYVYDKIYKKNHGNYWSYFEDHQAVMNDNFDIGNSTNSKSRLDDDGMASSRKRTESGIMANEKILREHGVHSGINFAYFDKY